VLVNKGKAVPRLRITQDYVAPTFKGTDRIPFPVIKIIVEPNPRSGDFPQQSGLDVPVIVEIFCDIQLEAWRSTMIDRATRKHVVDILADSHGIIDAQEIKRVLVWYEEQIGIAHDTREVE
jgi:hypothetical protein